MRRVQEGVKTPAQHALERALKEAVWVKGADGNYETIIPNPKTPLTNLTAIAAIQNQEDTPLLCYELVDGANARRVKVSESFVKDYAYAPILLKFDDKSLTNSLLYLLNSEWELENNVKQDCKQLRVTSLMTVGNPDSGLAKGVEKYLENALNCHPNVPQGHPLNTWNGAIIANPDTRHDQLHIHLCPELSQALFGGDLEKLMNWRRSLDQHLGRKNANQPTTIHVATDFTALQAILHASPTTTITPAEAPKKIRAKKTKQDQLPLNFGDDQEKGRPR